MSEKHVKVRNRSQERVRRVDLDFLRIREELEIDLQEKLKSKNLLVFLFDKNGVDAPLSELVKHHNPKQCNPKCDKQYQRIRPSSVTPSTAAAMHPLVVSHLSLFTSPKVVKGDDQEYILNNTIKYEWLLCFSKSLERNNEE